MAVIELLIILIEMVIELIGLVIELFVATLELIAEGAMLLAELAIMLFGGTRKFKRLKLRRPRTPVAEMTSRQRVSRRGAVCLAILLLLVFSGYSAYRLSTRIIRVTADDGTPAPVAKFVWDKKSETRHTRTDLNGDLKLPRFGLKEVRIEDRRYEPRTWKGRIPEHLVLQRTAAGKLADPFLLRAKGK
jgi:hypothetical protein